MNDSLMYPCLTHLMKILDQKERSQPHKKPFYHANLVMDHFMEGRKIFNQQQQVNKVFRNYYRQRWILKQEFQVDQTDSCAFLRQMQKENITQRFACQIVVRLLIVGIESLLNMELDKYLLKDIVKMYEELRLALIFESQSVTDILLPFIQKLTLEIKSLLFYENLLTIFKRLDNCKIVECLERTLAKFRQQWNKTQQQIKTLFTTTKKKNRQSVFMPSPKRNLSLVEKQKLKTNEQSKENVKQSHKSKEKETQTAKSTFKLAAKTPKKLQANPRTSFYHGKSYHFNSRTSTSDIFSSTESISFEQTKYPDPQSYRILSQTNLNYTSSYCSKIEQKEEGILADNTPEKKKKNTERKL